MKIKNLISLEKNRQQNTISLIASENYVSKEIREAVASELMNKYAEGYPGRRYYGGNEVVDRIEQSAIDAAKQLFGAEHANVQPYSGTPANLAIYNALLEIGDTVMGMNLSDGGHLSHGHKVSFSSKAYKFVQYGVDSSTGLLDYDEIEKLAKIFKPKLIVCGTTAYPREVDFKKFAEIARKVGAYCLADISHTAGLIAAGLHQNPIPYCDVVMTTTHKTLRGPRGAIILCNKDLGSKIDKAVFPGIQGGPHVNTIAAKTLCLQQAKTAQFKKYAKQVIYNAKALAEALKGRGFKLSTDGTDSHLVLLDLSGTKLTGAKVEKALETVGIIVNKNTIPGDTRSPFDPSGLRLGTPAVTTRGMKEEEMEVLADCMDKVVHNLDNKVVLDLVRKKVKQLAKIFPIP